MTSGPEIFTEVQVEQICQTKMIWLTMSMNTLISSENKWPHTLAVQIKRRWMGSCLSAIRQPSFEWHQIQQRQEMRTQKSDWWRRRQRRRMTLVTFEGDGAARIAVLLPVWRQRRCTLECVPLTSTQAAKQQKGEGNCAGHADGYRGRTVGTVFCFYFYFYLSEWMLTGSCLTPIHTWAHSRGQPKPGSKNWSKRQDHQIWIFIMKYIY